jgi:hypothetical protein
MSFKSPNAKFMLRLNKLSKVCKYSNIVFKYGSHRLALAAIPRYSTTEEERFQRSYHVFSWIHINLSKGRSQDIAIYTKYFWFSQKYSQLASDRQVLSQALLALRPIILVHHRIIWLCYLM